MKCEFDYCVYNKDFLCTLKEIQINSLGMCEECVIVPICDEVLELFKKKAAKENAPI